MGVKLPQASLFPVMSDDDVIQQIQAEMADQEDWVPEIMAAYESYASHQPSGEELLNMQRQRLEAILQHAFQSVPAYREQATAASGTDPFRVLRELPPVNKHDMVNHSIDYCDEELDPVRCRATVTSGTTGEPFEIIHSLEHLVDVYALALRRGSRHGLGVGRRILVPFQSRASAWFEYTSPAAGFARIAEFGRPHEPDPDYWRDTAQRVGLFAPDVLWIHPSQGIELVELLARHGVSPPQPRVVYTLGENLLPALRQWLSDAFTAPVYDLYGMREVHSIAEQCVRGAYHIEAERLWVEVVDDGGQPVPDGVPGEIVVTDLLNTAMPFLRYRTGDIGTIGTARCPCGLPHKTLRLLEGRSYGSVVLPDGTHLELISVARIVRKYPLRRFQLVQTGQQSLEVLIKALPEFRVEDEQKIDTEIKSLTGPDFDVSIRLVEDEAFYRSGNRKAVDFVTLLPPSEERWDPLFSSAPR
jgi:phenylacetate-CoA ligase